MCGRSDRIVWDCCEGLDEEWLNLFMSCCSLRKPWWRWIEGKMQLNGGKKWCEIVVFFLLLTCSTPLLQVCSNRSDINWAKLLSCVMPGARTHILAYFIFTPTLGGSFYSLQSWAENICAWSYMNKCTKLLLAWYSHGNEFNNISLPL